MNARRRRLQAVPDVLDVADGRARTDELEDTIAVWLIPLGIAGGDLVGPVRLQLREDRLDGAEFVTFSRGGDLELFDRALAEGLAHLLGVPLMYAAPEPAHFVP